MGRIEINDKNMYQYFDDLFYGNNDKFQNWSKTEQTGEYGLTNYDVASMLGSKSLLYGETDAQKQLCTMEALQKFFHQYIGIEGLEELLVNNYGTIENSIFFEHDTYGQPVHIREHAKHQMKNAYLGSELLLECGYLKDMARNIYEAESRVTQYLVQQAEAVVTAAEEAPKKGRRKALEENEAALRRNKILDKLEEWSYKIFMVSSLLHDIGYPLEFYLRSAKKLADYPPYLKILSPTIKADFSEIKSHLLGSQLFKLIDNEKIKEKYNKDNHGALSAVSMLMHFYYGGRIYSLSREERCIIEMSAIAIYRHTDRFTDGFRMVYRQDPISYMVRLCDDLQEWERFKILVNDKHNYLQCDHCGKLLLEKERAYSCSCGKSYRKVTQINNKKINYVCMCDELSIEKSKGKTKIVVQFNLMKQFEMLLDDYTAVTKSNADLEKVQSFVEEQSLMPKLEIEFFVSNNPYMIIERMIRESGKKESEIQEWIDSQEIAGKRENLNGFFKDYLSKKNNNPFGKKIEHNKMKYEKKVCEYVKQYYGEVYSLYQMLTEDRGICRKSAK